MQAPFSFFIKNGSKIINIIAGKSIEISKISSNFVAFLKRASPQRGAGPTARWAPDSLRSMFQHQFSIGLYLNPIFFYKNYDKNRY